MSDWEIIHAYSRTQALADGVLIDVTETATEAGFAWPVAVTAAVWEDCVAWTDADNERKNVHQDEKGRLWDVLWMAHVGARRSRGATIRFTVARVPREGKVRRAQKVELIAMAGPGDNHEPVVTIMQPGED